MTRLTLGVIGVAALAVTACGSAAASSSGGAATPSPSSGRFGRNLAAGQLVQVTGTTLILSNANGDITVSDATAASITQQRTGTVADIVPGTCVAATGQKDGTGAFTASTVRVSTPQNGSCFLNGFGGGGTNPRPSFSFSPRPNLGNLSVVSGEVTPGGVNGTSVTVKERSGTIVTITVPTTVRVVEASPIAANALSVGQCITATGPRSSAGVVQARTLTIVPPGPNGCFSGGGAGGGGGFFGGGGGLFGGGGAGTGTAA